MNLTPNQTMLDSENCISGHSQPHHDACLQPVVSLDFILVPDVRDQKPEGGAEDADPAKDDAEKGMTKEKDGCSV